VPRNRSSESRKRCSRRVKLVSNVTSLSKPYNATASFGSPSFSNARTNFFSDSTSYAKSLPVEPLVSINNETESGTSV
jgi:hypothetical protein